MGVLAVFLVVVSVTASQGDLRKGCTADGFYILPSKSKTFSRNFNGRSSRYWFERESAAPCDNKMVQIKNDIKYEECFERCYSSECQQVKFEKKSYKDEVGTCIMCPTFQPGNQNTYKRINKSQREFWGACYEYYHKGGYLSEVTWSRLQLDPVTLVVNTQSHEYATRVSGTDWLPLGSATDCFHARSLLGRAEIDLRNTPFSVKLDAAFECSNDECKCECDTKKECFSCGQWEVKGHYATMVVTCTERNQRCVVQCGGNSGACKVKNNALQLLVVDESMLREENCLVPEDLFSRSITARLGTFSTPLQIRNDYVTLGSGTHGRVDFTVIAHEDGPVGLSVVVSPTAYTHNAWVISFDDDQPHEWHADQLTATNMNRLSIDKPFQLDAGRHTLHLDIRQPRTRIQSITITSGHASFIAACRYNQFPPFDKIDILSKCKKSFLNSKFGNGCQAYATGWKAGDSDCHTCDEVNRDFAACDLSQCTALCKQLYSSDKSRAMHCMDGCYRYDYLLAQHFQRAGSPTRGPAFFVMQTHGSGCPTGLAITSAVDCAYAATAVGKRLIYTTENPTDDTECFVTQRVQNWAKWAPASSSDQDENFVAPGPAICHADLSCETGIRALVASNICCLKSCGKCGDTGCGLRPGGAVGCCVQSIENSKRSCAAYPPPCIVPVISISSTTTTSKGTTLTSTTGTATTTFGKIADSISSKIITPTTVTMPPRSTSATTITTTTSASTDYDSDHRSTIATTTTTTTAQAVSTSSEKKWNGRDTADSKTQDKVKDLKNTLEKQVQKNDDQREKISSTAIILGAVSAMIVVVIVVVSLVLCLRHKKRLVEPDVRNEHKEMGHAVSAERDITDLAKPSSPSVSRARLESAAHMYRLDVGNIQLDDNPEHATSADRTLKTSYFKSLYDMARVPEDCVEFLQSVKQLILLHAQSHDIPERMWQGFYQKLYHEAWKQPQVLQGDVAAAAEYVWTSGKSLKGVEFCSMLNAALRGDRADQMVHVAMFTRAINQRRIQRVPNVLKNDRYPKNGKLWRGTSFDDVHRPFFHKNKMYRVPGFLATSLSRTVSGVFIYKVPSGMRSVEWCILVDPKGKSNFKKRCRNASYVAKTHLEGEGEYLFAPYSVFTVRKVKWSDDPREEHCITVAAAIDNALESDDLPLAPWY